MSAAEVKREMALSSRPRVTEWTKGKGAPSPEEYPRLASILGVNTDWLLGGPGPRHVAPIPAEVQGYRDMAAIVEKIRLGEDAVDAVGHGENGGGGGPHEREG